MGFHSDKGLKRKCHPIVRTPTSTRRSNHLRRFLRKSKRNAKKKGILEKVKDVTLVGGDLLHIRVGGKTGVVLIDTADLKMDCGDETH